MSLPKILPNKSCGKKRRKNTLRNWSGKLDIGVFVSEIDRHVTFMNIFLELMADLLFHNNKMPAQGKNRIPMKWILIESIEFLTLNTTKSLGTFLQ